MNKSNLWIVMRQTLKIDKMEERTKTEGKTVTITMPERIKKLLAFIKEGLVEKDEAIRLALLSAIAGESIFLLGSPGTAKSLISRRIKCAFKASEGKEVSYFEYLMNQFSTPDELFGPVSLKKLEQDSYERITDGYLPNAEVAFLDEIWKASPAIQNTLLTIINEKKYHNGTSVLQVPLKVLLSASNELPAENQGLEALWDRFLLRLLVAPIQDEDSFLALVCGKPVKSEVVPSPEMADVMISTKELEQWKKKIHAVSVPEDVQEVLASLRYKMRELDQKHPEKHTYYISDRRWTKIVNLLRTSAFLNGRNHVDLMDCYLISYCIWNDDSVIEEVRELVKESIRESGHGFFKEIEEIQNRINGKNADSFDAFVMNNFYEDTEAKPKYHYRIKKNSFHFLDELTITDEDIVTWVDGRSSQRYTARIEMDSPEWVEGNTLELAFLKEKAQQKYTAIRSSIAATRDKINKYLKEKELQYKSNLFVDSKIGDLIITKVKQAKDDLDVALEELEKVKFKYHDIDETR